MSNGLFDAKQGLERLGHAAASQGRMTMQATVLAALAYIEELEAELAASRQGQQRGGFARAQAMSPDPPQENGGAVGQAWRAWRTLKGEAARATSVGNRIKPMKF